MNDAEIVNEYFSVEESEIAGRDENGITFEADTVTYCSSRNPNDFNVTAESCREGTKGNRHS